VYRRILIGYEDSAGARDALRLADQLTSGEGAELHVAICLPYDPLALPPDAYERAIAEDSERLFAQVGEQLGPEREFEPHSVGGVAVAAALHSFAEELEADAIVVGSSERGGIGRVLPGGVGERLLHGAPCAVVVAPREHAERGSDGIELIGVGYDGEPESRNALAAAEQLAPRLHAELRLIGVVGSMDPRDVLGGRMPPVHEDLKAETEEALAAMPDGVEATATLLEGEPAEVLAEQGAELDLLVIGSRGYGPLRHALLGGESGEVIRTARCPVMVVPRGAHPHGE
jgi:nucleotide-binding universal stress UspA family protein